MRSHEEEKRKEKSSRMGRPLLVLIILQEVRFKNQGLDSIEVQDNGSGISPSNYESIALKHYTSKLFTYADLDTLETFGFRGEALSSLCALSHFSIVTCLASDVPKGSKLDFESSGKLRGASIIAAKEGTTVYVEDIFHNLPVRRRELERNVKREYNKAVALLNQYACIQVGLKLTVSQQPNKGKRVVLFSTKGNPSTRENIINVFGAKTINALVTLDLELELEPSSALHHDTDGSSRLVRVRGHVSRPANGEGRQTPDRQMFFVNGRPCSLPQFAKVFNEVYKSYNSSQAPFIFANIQLDTHLYDINVSPDKRIILLHEQSRMLDTLRDSLGALFKAQDYTVPVAQLSLKSGVRKTGNAPIGSTNSPTHQVAGSLDKEAARAERGTADGDSGSFNEKDSEKEQDTLPSDNFPSTQSISGASNASNLLSRWIHKKADETTRISGDSTSSINENELATVPGMLQETKPVVLTDSLSTEHDLKHCSPGMESEESDSRVGQDVVPTILGTIVPLGSTQGLQNTEEPTVLPSADAIGADSNKVETRTSAAAQSPSKLSSQKRDMGDVVLIKIGQGSARQRTSHPQKKFTTNDAQHRPKVQATFGGRLANMFAAKDLAPVGNSLEGTTRSEKSISPEPEGSVDGNSDEEVEDDAGVDARSKKKDIPPSPSINDSDLPSDSLPDDESHGSGPEEESNDEEANSIRPSTGNSRSASMNRRKDGTQCCVQELRWNEALIQRQLHFWKTKLSLTGSIKRGLGNSNAEEENEPEDAEEKLSLTISKTDFGRMKIIGQFNKGFVLAVRHASKDSEASQKDNDEVFIIDQHASDEKYNFERLQAGTIIDSQRLVHPKRLELTAVEEEVVKDNLDALLRNGFKVEIDEGGDYAVGSRCQLLALPLSRETTLGLPDLEELISMLSEHQPTSEASLPRPSKVRKMFAMRACRSSVMVGKDLTPKQMQKLVRHMGELDKPWNCPHGRPTMRHLSSLRSWETRGWSGDKDISTRSWARYAGRLE